MKPLHGNMGNYSLRKDVIKDVMEELGIDIVSDRSPTTHYGAQAVLNGQEKVFREANRFLVFAGQFQPAITTDFKNRRPKQPFPTPEDKVDASFLNVGGAEDIDAYKRPTGRERHPPRGRGGPL